MSDDTPFGPTPTATSVYPPDTGATNVGLAREFLSQHRGAMEGRAPDIDNVLSRMQLNTDSMTKMLDDTTAAIKASRNGRVNAPLMAMASGMLSNKGNFGEQLGEGFGRMVPAIHQDRQEEDNVNFQLGQLALRRGALENLPLEKKLAYQQALQMGDLTAVRAIEQALIRAQGTAGKTDVKEAQLMQKTVQQALEEARKSVAQESTEMYATNDERLAAIRERFIQNIEVMRAAGMPVPQNVIDQVTKTMQATPSAGTAQQKSYFNAPTSPEARGQAVERVGVEPPPNYEYETVGPKDRIELMKRNQAAFDKESKDWDTQSKISTDMLQKIKQAEALLSTPAGKRAVGPQFGVGVNPSWTDTSKEAQILRGLFNGININNIPQGQGAVSNMERELFASAGANMNVNDRANLELLGIQKEIMKRDIERREFFSNYYNEYKTLGGGDMVSKWERYINSPEGSAVKYEGSKIVPNKDRISYKEFFKKERQGGSAGNRKDGGFIKLGAEYD